MESAVECGSTWRGWLAKYDHDMSLWRTAQCSLIEEESELLETLPRSGMTRAGLLWELPMLERRTSETGSGLWLTPRATDVGKGERQETFLKRMGDRTDRCAQSLAAQVNNPKTWPTPTVCGNYNRKGVSKTSGDGLATAVAKRMWPTPNAGNEKWGGTMQEWGVSKNWVRQEMPELARGALNPMWVEWLMGWPLGWTDLKPLATDKSPCVQQQHGEF
jgi:hypothetical protein